MQIKEGFYTQNYSKDNSVKLSFTQIQNSRFFFFTYFAQIIRFASESYNFQKYLIFC